MAYPIEVSGFDKAGRLYRERTVTRNISKSGCCFPVKTQLKPGDVVAIRLAGQRNEKTPPNKALLFQIVWVAPEGKEWIVGALNLHPENIWNVDFPSSTPPKPSPT